MLCYQILQASVEFLIQGNGSQHFFLQVHFGWKKKISGPHNTGGSIRNFQSLMSNKEATANASENFSV